MSEKSVFNNVFPGFEGAEPTAPSTAMKELFQSIPVREYGSNQTFTNLDYRDAYDDVCAELAILKQRELPIVIARAENTFAGEWAALYIDGLQVISETELTAEAVLDALGIKYRAFSYSAKEARGERSFLSFYTEADFERMILASEDAEAGEKGCAL